MQEIRAAQKAQVRQDNRNSWLMVVIAIASGGGLILGLLNYFSG